MITASNLRLALFGFRPPGKPTISLEARMIKFLSEEPTAESLDKPDLMQGNGAQQKADFLMNNRKFIVELKTLNGDPKRRVEQRLKTRLTQPGAPIVIGRMGLGPILDALSDGAEVRKLINDLTGRAVRRHLQKAHEQVAATRSQLGLGASAGLLILMNEQERMIDAANIGYSIRAAIEAVEGGYSELSYIWASVETHTVRLSDGTAGFPQLLAFRENPDADQVEFVARMLDLWAVFNGSELQGIERDETWNALRPIFAGGPPTLNIF
jgi:hypothetical protein